MSIRTIVVDDEPLAREGLILSLAEDSDIEVIAECGNGSDAIKAIIELNPDLVFLDIQMPRFNGFDVLREIKPQIMPLIIFVTAYDKYAVKAFKVNALDYLLKPIAAEQLEQSLLRAKDTLLRQNLTENSQRLTELLAQMSQHRTQGYDQGQETRLVVKSHGHVHFLHIAEIDWVEASGDYVTIHIGDKTHLLRETMGNMEKRLDSLGFMRIHRSTIVNLKCVRELKANRNNDYDVVLLDGTVLNLGRSYKDSLYQSLSS